MEEYSYIYNTYILSYFLDGRLVMKFSQVKHKKFDLLLIFLQLVTQETLLSDRSDLKGFCILILI